MSVPRHNDFCTPGSTALCDDICHCYAVLASRRSAFLSKATCCHTVSGLPSAVKEFVFRKNCSSKCTGVAIMHIERQ